MSVPSALEHASREGHWLVVWGTLAFRLNERPPANRASVMADLIAATAPQGSRQPQAKLRLAQLPLLRPVSILSLDASDQVEQAFKAAGVAVQIVRTRQTAPARQGFVLLKLAGDLATRTGLILSRAELRELHGDPDKRYLLDEARRTCEGGAVLLVGCDPANADFLAWWDVLAPVLRADVATNTWFALGDPQAAWPPGVTCMGQEMPADLFRELGSRIERHPQSAATFPVWSYPAGSGVASVAVSADGSRILAGTLGKQVLCLNPKGELLWSADVGNQAWRVAMSADGRVGVVGTGSTRPWDMKGRGLYAFDQNGQLTWQQDLAASIWGLALSDDGRTLAAGTDSRQVLIYDSAGRRLWQHTTPGLGWWAWVWTAALAADGQTVAVGSANSTILIFDRGGNLLGQHRAASDVFVVSVSADGQTIAAGSSDQRVYILDRPGQLIKSVELEDKVWSLALLANGQRLIVGAGEKEAHVRVFDRAGQTVWKRFVEGGIASVAASSRGQLIAVGTRTGQVYLFDRDGEPVHQHVAQQGIRQVAVSADGRVAATASEDGHIYGFLPPPGTERTGSTLLYPQQESSNMQWNTQAMRELLSAAFSDEEISTLCFDRFRAVYDDFSSGMSKSVKLQRLVEHCDRNDQMDALAREVEKRNPAQYKRFAPRLRDAATPSTREASDTPTSATSPASPPGPIRNRWALLVGINQYIDPAIHPLKFCIKDVIALESTLRALGYTVVALRDDADQEHLLPTRDNVEAELARLCQAAGPDDLLLAHFACHGKLVNGQPVLITRETRLPTLATKALPLAEVERQMRASAARRRVLVLDACHTGVEIGRDLADPEFIRNAYELAEGFALLAASSSQQVAQEWEQEQHGVFSYFLLQGLSGQADHARKGFVTVDDLKTYVLDGVRRWNVEHSGILQEPTARAEGVGDMILADYRDHPQPEARPSHVPNPFTDTLAVRDAARFIGRQAELRRLRAMLQGGSVALLGEPKIGKSSLLWQLARTWTGKVIGPLDCMELEGRADLYQRLAQALEANDADWRTLRELLRAQAALVLLDELDCGPERGINYEDLARFRALCSANPSVKLVAVSRTPLKTLFPDPGRGSPAYNFLVPLTLGPLTEVEARALLAHPWAADAPAFDAGTVGALLALAGCHPFKLQRAAFHRYEALTDAAYDWRAAYNQDVEQML